MTSETRAAKLAIIDRVADAISDEIAKADFPGADRWMEPFKRFRVEILEERMWIETQGYLG